MKVRRSSLKDEVSVATYAGESAYGPTYSVAVTVRCNIDQTRRLVRDNAGDETVSEVTLQLHPRTRVVPEDLPVAFVDPLVVFAPESLVTVGGRTSRVLGLKNATARGRTVLVEVTCA